MHPHENAATREKLRSWCVFLSPIAVPRSPLVPSDCTQLVLRNGSCLMEPIVPCAESCGAVLLRSLAGASRPSGRRGAGAPRTCLVPRPSGASPPPLFNLKSNEGSSLCAISFLQF